jgi:hypothetical protein
MSRVLPLIRPKRFGNLESAQSQGTKTSMHGDCRFGAFAFRAKDKKLFVILER